MMTSNFLFFFHQFYYYHYYLFTCHIAFVQVVTELETAVARRQVLRESLEKQEKQITSHTFFISNDLYKEKTRSLLRCHSTWGDESWPETWKRQPNWCFAIVQSVNWPAAGLRRSARWYNAANLEINFKKRLINRCTWFSELSFFLPNSCPPFPLEAFLDDIGFRWFFAELIIEMYPSTV